MKKVLTAILIALMFVTITHVDFNSANAELPYQQEIKQNPGIRGGFYPPKPGFCDNVVAGDANKDGIVDISDLVMLTDYLYTQCAMDYNKDGKIDEKDLKEMTDYMFPQ